MNQDAGLFEVFLDVQRGLPRQGPGCDEGTLRALSLCGGLPEKAKVLDVGCGPGMQTVALARAVDGHVTAVDTTTTTRRAPASSSRRASGTWSVRSTPTSSSPTA